jgi:hypothetical protein
VRQWIGACDAEAWMCSGRPISRTIIRIFGMLFRRPWQNVRGRSLSGEAESLPAYPWQKVGVYNVFIISTVDNVRTIPFVQRIFYPFAGVDSVEVPPGPHDAVLSTRYDGKISIGALQFVAEAGPHMLQRLKRLVP